MKKLTSLLLCMVLVLSMFTLNAEAAGNACIEAGVTASGDGTVTVAVTALQAAANARLTLRFDPDRLSYVGCESPFAVCSVKAEDGKLTIGLANSSTSNEAGELAALSFRVTGSWDQTDITVTAERLGGRTVNEAVTLTVQGGGYRFQDVTADQWFFEAVDRMAAEGYINGISATHFGPGLNMNRASFVTLLGRLEGIEKVNAETGFTDVPVDSFYSGYVAWAVEKGITNGLTESLFGPAEPVNRAQMVTFLYRYAVSEGMDVTVADADAVLAGFGDAAELPQWAVAPFAWAVQNGVINGMDGKLVPGGTANRAQVAVMLYRFFFEQ